MKESVSSAAARTASPDGESATADAIGAKPLGVYVHFPWCLAKCPYCDFLSVAADRPSLRHAAYADAVIAELARRASEMDIERTRLRSVFFGGGTPSLWNAQELGRVLAAVLDLFRAPSAAAPSAAVEITVECNPSSFDRDVGRALVEQGVNRVSLGIQSLHDDRLKFLGRLHDARAGLAAVESALEAGVPRVSADLIFGVAGQTAAEAASEVRRVAETGVTHVSAYALTIEPGTTFGALARKGRLPMLGEVEVAESFLGVEATLSALGFSHYEVSNYARDGHVAEHNLGYWRGADYLGLGCGAWGTMHLGGGHARYRNTPVPERYLDSTGAWAGADLETTLPGGLIHEVEPLAPETRLSERIMLGLRTREGVDVEASAASLGIAPWPDRRDRAVRKWIDRGRLRRQGGRLTIPEELWLTSESVVADVM
jgi:putative oxygen-independent coproporphyrinogen III oxidase